MIVRCVLCHPTNDVSGERRQIILLDHLSHHGHDVEIFCISQNGQVEVISDSEGETKIRYFPPDDPSQTPHDTTSKKLLNALCQDDPQVVLVKGIDYSQAKDVFAAFNSDRLGVIIGGTSAHPLLNSCKLILFETEGQLANYHGRAVSRVLPKLIPWNVVQERRQNKIRYDIVNIGNFDEPRKAQELLLPFSLHYRVLFIGSGRRLSLFQALTSHNQNISFAGYVSPDVLFTYLAQSRLMVHCSTWDGYPRAVAESLAAGVPVIGLAGVLDGITDQPFIATASLEQLYQRVFSALQAPSDLDKLGTLASEYMRRTASLATMQQIFVDSLADAFGRDDSREEH